MKILFLTCLGTEMNKKQKTMRRESTLKKGKFMFVY